MRNTILLFLIILISGCNQIQQKKDVDQTVVENYTNNVNKPDSLPQPDYIKSGNPYKKEYLELNDVLINNNKGYMTLSEFKKIYSSNNPTYSDATDKWGCGTPFPLDQADKEWMKKIYGDDYESIYEVKEIEVTNIDFISNNHIVLLDKLTFDSENNIYIPSHNIILDKNTTIEQFQRLFPKLQPFSSEYDPKTHFVISVSNSCCDEDIWFSFQNGTLVEMFLASGEMY